MSPVPLPAKKKLLGQVREMLRLKQCEASRGIILIALKKPGVGLAVCSPSD